MGLGSCGITAVPGISCALPPHPIQSPPKPASAPSITPNQSLSQSAEPLPVSSFSPSLPRLALRAPRSSLPHHLARYPMSSPFSPGSSAVRSPNASDGHSDPQEPALNDADRSALAFVKGGKRKRLSKVRSPLFSAHPLRPYPLPPQGVRRLPQEQAALRRHL